MLAAAAATVSVCGFAVAGSQPPIFRSALRLPSAHVNMNLYELSAKRSDGNEVNMKMLTGKAALAINVASKGWGVGKGFKEVVAWNKKYGTDLNILMFPTGEFGDPTEEIEGFLGGFKLTKGLQLDGETGVTLMRPCAMNGDEAHPIFQLGKEAFPGEVEDNWCGCFLYDGDGDCVGRFDAKQGKGLKECGEALEALI